MGIEYFKDTSIFEGIKEFIADDYVKYKVEFDGGYHKIWTLEDFGGGSEVWIRCAVVRASERISLKKLYDKMMQQEDQEDQEEINNHF